MMGRDSRCGQLALTLLCLLVFGLSSHALYYIFLNCPHAAIGSAAVTRNQSIGDDKDGSDSITTTTRPPTNEIQLKIVPASELNSGWLLFVPQTTTSTAAETSASSRAQATTSSGRGRRRQDDLVATLDLDLDADDDEPQIERNDTEIGLINSTGKQVTKPEANGIELSSKLSDDDVEHLKNRKLKEWENNGNTTTTAREPNESFTATTTSGGDLQLIVRRSNATEGRRFKRRAGLSSSERGKPILNEFSFPANLVQGMRFVLMCQVLDGEPPIQIKWFKDNLDLGSLLQLSAGPSPSLQANGADQQLTISGQQQSNQNYALGAAQPLDQLEMLSRDELGASSSLLFRKVKQQHGGNYTCLASNHFGTSAYSSLMTVKVPPSWRLEPQDHEAIMGEHITIDCQASGNPNPFIRWKFTSVQHDKTSPADQLTGAPKQPSHQMAAPLASGAADTFPTLSSPDGSQQQQQRSFKLINSNHHVQTLENGSLAIRQARPEHEGLYLCEADNGVEPSLTKQVRLIVHKQAHFLDDIQVHWQLPASGGEPLATMSRADQQQLGLQPATAMQSAGAGQVAAPIKSIKLPQNSSLVRLVCRPRGELPLQLDWLKDGRLIHTSSGPANANAAADGQPQAIDHQAGGEQQQQAHLSQTIGRYHVSTRWLNDNRLLISGGGGGGGGGGSQRPATTTTSAGGELANGLESELLLTNLARHEAGLFACAARNAFGQAERKLRLIVQEQPEAPSLVDVAHISSRSIALRWLAPFDGNSPILKYVIEYRKLASGGGSGGAPGATGARADQQLYGGPLIESANAVWADPSGTPAGLLVGKSEKLMPAAAAVAMQQRSAPTEAGEQAAQMAATQQQQQLTGSGGAQIQHTVHELEPMTRYSMRVLAVNALGQSRPSVALALKTEEEVPATVPNLVEASVLGSRAIKLRWTISYSLEHELIDGFFIGYRSFDAATLVAGEQSGQQQTASLADLSKSAPPPPFASSSGEQARPDQRQLAPPERPTFTYKTIRLTNQQQQDYAAAHLDHQAHQTTPVVAPISSVTKSVAADTLPGGGGGASFGATRSATGSLTSAPVQQQDVAFVISNFEHVINGLERNTEYTFLIQCFNKRGAGPASDPVTAKTLVSDPPDKLILLADGLSETSLRVQWHFRGESRFVDPPPPPPPMTSLSSSNQDSVDGFVLTFAKVAPRSRSATGSSQPTQKQRGVSLAAHGHRLGDAAARISQPQLNGSQVARYHEHPNGQQAQRQQQRQQELAAAAPPPLQPDQLLDQQWQAIQLAPQQRQHALKGLECGTWYAMKAWAFNKIGKGEPSDLVTVATRGKAPVAPDRRSFLTINSTQVKLQLSSWYDGGCEIEKFFVQYRPRGSNQAANQLEWILVSSSISRDQASVSIRDLTMATTYELLVGAQNHVGQTEARYRFATLDAEGKQVPLTPSFSLAAGGGSGSENLPSIDSEDGGSEDANLVLDYPNNVDDSSGGGGGGGPMRELFGTQARDSSLGGLRWFALIKQVLNSPLILLLAFCLFLILLVLLVFHRLNAPHNDSPDQFGSNSSNATLHSSSSGAGKPSCGLAANSTRRCSFDGTATMIDGEPPLSHTNTTNGSSETESPARNGGERMNSLLGTMNSTYTSPIDCYNATSTYCPGSAASQARLQLSQQAPLPATGNNFSETNPLAASQVTSFPVLNGHYNNVTSQQQQQQHVDYYSPSIYAGIHRTTADLANSCSQNHSQEPLSQAEQDCRQQYLMQMLLMSPQQQQHQHQQTASHLNDPNQAPMASNHSDSLGASNYSMAAALTTLARQEAGLLRAPGGVAQLGANATLGRQLTHNNDTHTRCGDQATAFQTATDLASMDDQSSQRGQGVYQMTTFSRRSNATGQNEAASADMTSLYQDCPTQSSTTSTSTTSGCGTSSSTSQLIGGRGFIPANSIRRGESAASQQQQQQQVCDTNASTTTTTNDRSQYDVPFKFLGTKSQQNV